MIKPRLLASTRRLRKNAPQSWLRPRFTLDVGRTLDALEAAPLLAASNASNESKVKRKKGREENIKEETGDCARQALWCGTSLAQEKRDGTLFKNTLARVDALDAVNNHAGSGASNVATRRFTLDAPWTHENQCVLCVARAKS